MRSACLDAGDVGSQKVDPVSVEVAAGSVVVLGSAGVGVPGQNLSVSERYTCVESVGDGSVPQGVRADVARNTGDLRDPGDHAVDVAAVDRLAGDRPKDESPAGALLPAGFQDAEDGTVIGMVAGLLPLPTGAALGGLVGSRRSPRSARPRLRTL